MQLSALRTLVTRYGFDTTGDPVDDAINMAMFDLINHTNWNWLEAYSTTVTMGPADPALQGLPSAATLGRIISLRNVTAKWKMEEVSPQQFDLEVDDPATRGNPSIYFMRADTIYVYPLASVASTFTLHYELRASKLVNATDVPLNGFMPEDCQYAIPDKAASWLLQMENEEDRATNALANYTANLETLEAKYTKRSLDRHRQVVDVMGYTS